MSQQDLNPLFDLLAGDDNENIEGLVAYALYKRHKRTWAAIIREKHNRAPTADEERGFAESNATVDQLERYKMDAQDILIGFANSFVEDEKPQIEKAALSKEFLEASRTVKSSASFASLIKVGVASTLITSAILALLAFGTQYFGIDLVDALAIPNNSIASD
ncbi:MAG: hypothetical protein KJ731_08110 [Alphaproteobacteria bacterium]|nr:hypothetical protein [Alphaproteobacteria bacterium]MBU1281511.1 hypothetical protein [Alphaproteobacteria bacterium]MBU1572388.1 hypothetical protein [Alphaproteobacteria bacterium]MBU1828424.1 hypothetical protein [Alphaproteobacteria bacterium]MBU2077931.1 hypothetical protein [Alphaproteobacteria bacterium]